MGLLSSLVGLPLAPVRGTVWVAEKVQQEAERQYYDPELIRRELDEVDRLRREGVIDDEEADQRGRAAAPRMISDRELGE